MSETQPTMIPIPTPTPTPKDQAAALVLSTQDQQRPPVPPDQPFRAALRAELDWAIETHLPFPTEEHALYVIRRKLEDLETDIGVGDIRRARKTALALATMVIRMGEDLLTPKDRP